MSLGIYISVPFCRTKCSYCNFASDVFSKPLFTSYVERVCADIEGSRQTAEEVGGEIPETVDSIYFGGGTPTVLDPDQLKRIFDSVRAEFTVIPEAEITVECAPGTLNSQVLEILLRCGVNRVSLGVQSFIDRESAAVGRQHKRATILDDIARLRSSGISNINIDLIAGLPHQTAGSWMQSLDETVSAGAPHASVYMLEVDEDSRLGRELIAGGTRYHAHFVPNEDAVAEFYETACDLFESAGIRQYEISNFARDGSESRHNLKYWLGDAYLGFGVDAHSMLPSVAPGIDAIRFSTSDSLDKYVAGASLERTIVTPANALEEQFFLGLRLNCGVDLRNVAEDFGCYAVARVHPIVKQLESDGLVDSSENVVRLSRRGRLLSNEVFQRFIALDGIPVKS